MVYRMILCLLLYFNLLNLVELRVPICANEPLVLTKYIEEGKITEAQSLSFVEIEDFRNIISYSGYFQVNRRYDNNLFFWYFPSRSDPIVDPLILWLQGGPGRSSLVGLFVEHGPFRLVNKFDVKLRLYTWTKSYSVIYLDNPVGTGFSYTSCTNGYATNQTTIVHELYSALTQFFKMFPTSINTDLYLMGESYAAKYVISLGHFIHEENEGNQSKNIKLKGISVSSGFCDPINQIHYGDFLYEIGLVENRGKEQFNFLEECIKQHITNGSWEAAYDTFDQLIFGVLSNHTLYNNLTGLENYYNYLCHVGLHEVDEMVEHFLNLEDIRSALHIGYAHFNVLTTRVTEHLKDDIMRSVADQLPLLIDNYKVLFYNGQLDVLVGYALTENFIYKLQHSNISKFQATPRCIWRVDGEVAGYVKNVGHLTQAMIRNAGHLTSADQPKWVYDLVSRFIRDEDFCA